MTDTQPLEIHNSIWQNGVLAILSAAMAAGITFVSVAGNQPFDWRMWLGVALAAAGALLFGRRTFDRRPVLIIDDKGITVAKRWVGFLKWDNIAAAKLNVTYVRSSRGYFLYIWPRSPDDWWARLPWTYQISWKWLPKWRCISVPMLNVTPSPEAIQPYLDRFLKTSPVQSDEASAS